MCVWGGGGRRWAWRLCGFDCNGDEMLWDWIDL